MLVPRRVVDALPERLWKPGNLIIPRFGASAIGHWHFCVAGDGSGRSVRTVEHNGREVARGRRPFDFEAHAE
jgi:hypothetical protein